MGHRLTLRNINHHFGETFAARDVNLEVGGGELIALLGPSGCGKSTLLRIVSGFIAQTAGEVLFDDDSIDHLTPSRRGVGIVFQNYALFPHMTVAENVAYGLEARRWPKDRMAARVAEMLGLVHMGDFRNRLPRQLSGGQQQRVAVARCLAVDPKVLLLDEPFGALDKNLRLDMQIEVKRLQRAYGITTVLVTHDQEEALSMADRVAVMNQGRIEQVASPTDIYDRPATLFVNQFVGTTNVLAGELIANEGAHSTVRLAEGQIVPVRATPGIGRGAKVQISVRPELLRLHDVAASGRLPGVVRAAMPLGPHVVYEIELAGRQALKVNEPREGAGQVRAPGDNVHVAPAAPASCLVFAAS